MARDNLLSGSDSISSQHSCPLCRSADRTFYARDQRREYWQCGQCSLVFTPPDYWLSAAREKAEYDLHQNDIYDAGYRQFLSRLAEPLVKHLTQGSSGLDFGCGPTPALATMLEEQGFRMKCFDLFYLPDQQSLEQQYDFITATEVIEHLQTPDRVLSQLFSLLKNRGWLGLMTKLVRDQVAFSRWHYKNDRTHICFYSGETFRWIADHFHCHLEFHGTDVILLQKIAV